MAVKAFELRRMGIFDCVLFTGAVTFQARCVVVDRYISMNDVGRNAGITLSRYGKKQSDSQQHKNNKPNCAFHAQIIPYEAMRGVDQTVIWKGSAGAGCLSER